MADRRAITDMAPRPMCGHKLVYVAESDEFICPLCRTDRLKQRVAELEAENKMLDKITDNHEQHMVSLAERYEKLKAENAELRELLRWFCNNTFIGRGIATTEYERIRELLSEPTEG